MPIDPISEELNKKVYSILQERPQKNGKYLEKTDVTVPQNVPLVLPNEDGNGLGVGTPEWHQRMEGTAAYILLKPYCDMDVSDYGGCKALSAEKYNRMLEKEGLSEYAENSVTNYITLPDAIDSYTTLLIRKQTAELAEQNTNNGEKSSMGI